MLATYKVEELMKDAAVCVTYGVPERREVGSTIGEGDRVPPWSPSSTYPHRLPWFKSDIRKEVI